jgi:hypothetical protein
LINVPHLWYRDVREAGDSELAQLPGVCPVLVRDASTMDPYKDITLVEEKDIRLLALLPREDVSNVECNLKQASLKDEPLYAAVS